MKDIELLLKDIEPLPNIAREYSLKCSIACGCCCDDFWMNVEALAHFEDEGHTKCPHLGPKGCKLSREVRPDECIEYLCMMAKMHRESPLSKKEIQAILDAGAQNHPNAVLVKMDRGK